MKPLKIKEQDTHYLISECGEVYDLSREIFVKKLEDKDGYYYYDLRDPYSNKYRRYSVHRLVAENFLVKEDANKNEVHHIDNNRKNNCWKNLKWVSHKENCDFRIYPKIYCFTQNLELFKIFDNIEQASQIMNVSRSLISQEINNEKKQLTKGYYWSKQNYIKIEDIIYYRNTGKKEKSILLR